MIGTDQKGTREMATAKRSGKGGRATAKKANDERPVFTPEELFRMKQPIRLPFPVIVDSLIADARAEAEQALERAREAYERARITSRVAMPRAEAVASGGNAGPDPQLVEAAKAVDRAEEAFEEAKADAEAHTLVFMLKALGRKQLDELYADHPPTPEQQDEFEDDLRKAGEPTDQILSFNTDTFPPALICLSCISPAFTEDEAQELWDGDRFSKAELDALFVAAVNVNKVVRS